MTRRGAVHTLDALFAAMILATTLLYTSQIPRERDYTEESPLAAKGMQALLRLDGGGALGELVDSQSWGDVENYLRLALPAGVSFNLTVFDEQGGAVNDQLISNGGLLGRNVESVEFLIAVETGPCPLYRLRLQLGG